MKQKLLQVMKERDDSQPLSGFVQLDDAYWGGERHGGKRGRGAPGKTPFIAAMRTNDQGRPDALDPVEGISHRGDRALGATASGSGESGGFRRSQLLRGCAQCRLPAYGHRYRWRTGQRDLGSLCLGQHHDWKCKKRDARHHAVSEKHLPRYLAEFCYRFNRRFKLEDMITRLGYVAVHTPPMPDRFPKLAEAWG